MSRKKEITTDVWNMFRDVYGISSVSTQSEKQAELLEKIVQYVDNLLTQANKSEDKGKACSKK
jgi:uncharacterized protein YlxP (DUF503 family)